MSAALVATAGVPDLPDWTAPDLDRARPGPRQPVKVCLIYPTGPRQGGLPGRTGATDKVALIYRPASASR